MILKQAQDYYQNGVILSIKAVFGVDRWSLMIETEIDFFLITTVRGKNKYYLTLDALYVDIQRITGFSPSLSVDFSRFV